MLLMNVAYLYLKKSEFKQSVDYLERAKRVAPDNADIYKLEGWAYYGMNRTEQAVAEWKKALALKPDMRNAGGPGQGACAIKRKKKITKRTKARIFS